MNASKRNQRSGIEKSRLQAQWRLKTHEIIFEADTPWGRTFDISLIIFILLSVAVVLLESIATVRSQYGLALDAAEWCFTAIFTIEYVLRLLSVGRPWRYATSFYGVVDLLAILPSFLSLILPGAEYFLVIRAFRILRVFRVLKLVTYVAEASHLWEAMRTSRKKIMVFLMTVVIIVVIVGSAMYMIEGEESGFTSIPRSIYWAIVTMTTVGYGDIAPQTPLGQFLAAIVMILGYGIIAVPTGIVSAELSHMKEHTVTNHACTDCGGEGHEPDAMYCKFCGAKIE